MGRALVECVPNFSEGREGRVVDAIAQSISSRAGLALLDVAPGPDANRTVYTFVGSPEAVTEAALAAARTAYGLIDMSAQSGAHPRMGALDVCPFVPISGIDLGGCADLSRDFGEALARELGVPVYLYEAAASRPERASLAYLRAGEYEALPAKLAMPEWAPDYGPASFVPRWGATVVGAREFLIAFNVNLDTRDARVARKIAEAVRESGRAARDSQGELLRDAQGRIVRVSGRLKKVRAIGWFMESYRCAQVSVNLLDYRTTALHELFETVGEEARRLGARVTGGEIIGLVPLGPILSAGKFFLEKVGKSGIASEPELVEAARLYMGLDSVAPFEPTRKILEYAMSKAAEGVTPGLVPEGGASS